ncbi:MAG: hypothetical protein HY934_07720 [Candidatus Firestonebacteria bacterium]|nr:hypothetical protein [Candidatus Firestonebacteria bacterium]
MSYKNFFYIFVLLYFFISFNVLFTYESSLESAIRLSLAGAAGVPYTPDPLLLYYNPAIICEISRPELALNYIRFYNLMDIEKTSISFNYPFKKVPIFSGLLYEKQNIEDFTNDLLIIPIAWKKEKLNAGLNIKRYQINSSSEIKYNHNIDIGIIYFLSDMTFYYINRNTIKKESDFTISGNTTTGITIYPVKTMHFNIDYYSDDNNKDEFIFSEEINIYKYIFLRYGIQTRSNRYGIGTGINISHIKFDYGLLTHPVLDITHAFSLTYQFE